MTATYYVASKGVLSDLDPFKHMYLVKDADGDLGTTNDETIIRGGPSDGNGGDIKLELGRAQDDSDDRLNGQTPEDRNYTQISLTDGQWNDMLSYGHSISALFTGTGEADGTYLTEVPYHGVQGNNSNSTVTTLLALEGINIYDNLPLTGSSSVPAADRIYIDGSASRDVYVSDDRIHKIVDYGSGDTTIHVDGGALSGVGHTVQSIELRADDNSLSEDKIVLDDISLGDVSYARAANGDLNIFFTGDTEPSLVLKGQFSGGPQFDSLQIGVTTISLTDPNAFPSAALAGLSDLISHLHTTYSANNSSTPQTSPLVLDLDGDGVELTSLTGGGAAPVYWDIDNDGFREASAWVKPDDGLLVRDLNSNGIIDNHAELFGTNTTNGFTALAALDSNSSGTITSADTNWSSLQVWKDTNQDGISQSGELYSLASLGITSISVSPSTVNYTLAGNPVTHEATFTMGGLSHTIVDAWFNYDNVNTVYQGDYTLNPEALLLPELRGYGVISDLTIAMSQDGDLLDKVEAIADLDIIANPGDAAGLVQDALYQWAGVQGVDPDDRGTGSGWPDIDARDIRFTEKLFDELSTPTVTDAVWGPRGTGVEDVFREFETAATARLLLPLFGEQFFSATPTYDPVADTYSGSFTLDTGAISDAMAGKSLSEVIAQWSNILSMIVGSVGYAGIDNGLKSALNTAINDSDPNHLLTFDALVRDNGGLGEVMGVGGFALYDGTSGADSFSTISTQDKEDVFYFGKGGADTIAANTGRDVIFGGDGDDTISSTNYGFDRVYAGAGNDTIVEMATNQRAPIAGEIVDGGDGTDTIVGGDLSNLFISNVEVLNIQNNSSATVTAAQFAAFSSVTISGGGTHDIHAADAGTYNLGSKAGSSVVNLYGGVGNDTLIGDGNANLLRGGDGSGTSPGSGNDTLEGNGGADTLIGDDGNDTLTGGAGADTMTGGNGNDQFLVGGSEIVSGESMDGGSGTDSVQTWGGDLSLATITSVEQLGMNTNDITLSASELSGFTTLTRNGGGTANLQASAAGTYDISGKTIGAGTFHLYGSSGDDTLTGNSAGQTISGGDGNDTLSGLGGADTVSGGNGNDHILVGGSEVASGESMDGGAGTDTLETWGGDLSVATITGIETLGMHTDDLTLSSSELSGFTTLTRYGGGTANLHATDAGTYDISGKTISSGTFNLIGTSGNDTLTGNSGGETLTGGDGNDTLTGKGGADTLTGGNGNDQFLVGGSEIVSGESMDGGSGTDTLQTWGGDLSVATITSVEQLAMNTDNLTLSASQLDGFTTLTRNGGGNAYLQASAAGTYDISGKTISSGTFHLTGSSGVDTLIGNSAGQTLSGGAGNDHIDGRGGADTLTGGADDDTFIFASGSGLDTITDFSVAGGDLLDVSGYSIHNLAGVSMAQVGSDTVITFDASNKVTLTGVTATSLTSSEFVFA